METNNHSKINSTEDVFNSLKIRSNILSSKQKKHLHNNGYLILQSTKFLQNNLGKLRSEIDKLIKKEGSLEDGMEKNNFTKKIKCLNRAQID